MIRLNKYLASAGIGSRRYCEELIKKAEVFVNGEIAHLGMKIDPRSDRISLKTTGPIIKHKTRLYYLMLYKPEGYITTMSDPFGRKTIKDLIPETQERIYPVGRLDLLSEGLLFLTNDGDLANKLIHPGSRVPKKYMVKIKGKPSSALLNKLKKGIKLEDGWAVFDSISQLRSTTANSWYMVTIHEGRNRLIRRVFSAIGHPVMRLKRISIADIGLGDLRPGEWRYLIESEVDSLKKFAYKDSTSS